MKLTVESTRESVDVTAGRARVWKGFTENGEQCLLFVRCLHSPELDRIQEFDDLDSQITCGVSSTELDRIGALVFQGDPRRLGENESKVVTELKAIADDGAADSTLRLEALGLMAEVGLGEDDDPTAVMPTQEFWRRVLELRRKRDETPTLMESSDLRSVGVMVFQLLARRPKSLASLSRVVHAVFGLKYGIEQLAPPDHPDTTPAEFKWRLALTRIKSDAATEIARMPSEPGARGAHLRFLKFRILDQIAAAAKGCAT